MSFSSAFTAESEATLVEEVHSDPYNLERFVRAQDEGGAFNSVVAAFRGGHRKPRPATWMWFVFPQMDHCQTQSLRERLMRDDALWAGVEKTDWFSRDVWPEGQPLTGLAEARAYLRHPVLGPRLRTAAVTVLESPFADAFTLMDNMSMDVARLHSSMTIFRQAARFPRCIHDVRRPQAGADGLFARVINRFFVSFDSSDHEDAVLDLCDWSMAARSRRGSRHRPTLRRLDQAERLEVERRLVEGSPCVCDCSPKQLRKMDEGTRAKIDLSQAVVEAGKQLPTTGPLDAVVSVEARTSR